MTLPRLEEFARGKTIDLGCGYMPYSDFISDRVAVYHGLDVHPRDEAVVFVADNQDMHMIEDATHDTAICLEVLEHTRDPFRAIHEIHRILRPGGILVLSVHHLSRLHDEPYDYFRFTRFGLQELLARGGFEVVSPESRGGPCSFLGHQLSTVLLGLAWGIPIVKELAWHLNSWLTTRLPYAADRFLNPSGVFATGYIAVARRPSVWNADLAAEFVSVRNDE